MNNRINLTINEYHDSIFLDFWTNTYSTRVHHIDESVGDAFDRLSIEFKDVDSVLQSPESFTLKAKSYLHENDKPCAERAIAEYYEFCYRKAHSLLDPLTKIPVPTGLWNPTSSQTRESSPIFQKESKCKRFLARVFAWSFHKIMVIGILAFGAGLLCIPDAGRLGYGYTIFCFSFVLLAVIFFFIEKILGICGNAEFIGDVQYKITADKRDKDFSEPGIIKVANVYYRYVEAKYGYLADIKRRILALYLTSVYFKPFLRGQKPYTSMHQIIKSCMSLRIKDIIKFSGDMRSFSYKFEQEHSWTTVCAVCANFFRNGHLNLKLDPETGANVSAYEKIVHDSTVPIDQAVRICESDFTFIEPILNETHSEGRFNKIFYLADLSLVDWENYIILLAKSQLRNS